MRVWPTSWPSSSTSRSPTILRDAISSSQADLRQADSLIKLAVQFGHGTGKGGALRDALGADPPDPRAYAQVVEPHARGAILVAAVFDAFFNLHRRRIEDLLRLATGGTGVLPFGALQPDLVNRVADEAAQTADDVLKTCLRAFDYMPVLDADFGDYLRALVTADLELNPNDTDGKRAALIESFRARGIYPHDVTSLGEEALLWHRPGERGFPALPPLPESTHQMITSELVQVDRRTGDGSEDWMEKPAAARGVDRGQRRERTSKTEAHRQLRGYARANARALFLEGNNPSVAGFNPIFRVGEDGKLRTEIVAQFMEERKPRAELGGLRPSDGTTVVYSPDGQARYVIPTPWPHSGLRPALRTKARRRERRVTEFVAATDELMSDDYWSDDEQRANRMVDRFGFSSLHRPQGSLGDG